MLFPHRTTKDCFVLCVLPYLLKLVTIPLVQVFLEDWGCVLTKDIFMWLNNIEVLYKSSHTQCVQ